MAYQQAGNNPQQVHPFMRNMMHHYNQLSPQHMAHFGLLHPEMQKLFNKYQAPPVDSSMGQPMQSAQPMQHPTFQDSPTMSIQVPAGGKPLPVSMGGKPIPVDSSMQMQKPASQSGVSRVYYAGQ